MSRADNDAADPSGGDNDSNTDPASTHPPSTHPPSEDKTVDDSWKEEMRREKENLGAAPDPDSGTELPQASFLALVEELSLRVVFELGQMRNPVTGEQEINLPAARYTIDLLNVLEEKTRGNLSEEESVALGELLQRLRMAYVYCSGLSPGESSGTDSNASTGGAGESTDSGIIV